MTALAQIKNQRPVEFGRVSNMKRGTRTMTSQQGEQTAAEKAEQIWRDCAKKFGPVPRQMQGILGVNPDGSAAEGGLTSAGLMFASFVGDDGLPKVLKKIDEALKDCEDHGFPGPQASTGGGGEGLFGLRGPVRAALRAGAQALADELGDADDPSVDALTDRVMGEARKRGVVSGVRERRGAFTDLVAEVQVGERRQRTTIPLLGGEPFILIRFKEERPAAVGVPFGDGCVEVLAGGRGLGDLLDTASLLGVAVGGVTATFDRTGKALGMDGGPDAVVIAVADLEPFERQFGGEGNSGPGASAAGPSTEAPYGVPDSDTPREVPAEGGEAGDDGGDQGQPADAPWNDGDSGLGEEPEPDARQ